MWAGTGVSRDLETPDSNPPPSSIQNWSRVLTEAQLGLSPNFLLFTVSSSLGQPRCPPRHSAETVIFHSIFQVPTPTFRPLLRLLSSQSNLLPSIPRAATPGYLLWPLDGVADTPTPTQCLRPCQALQKQPLKVCLAPMKAPWIPPRPPAVLCPPSSPQ